MSNAEFSHFLKIRQIKAGSISLDANQEQRVALARRFAIPAVESLVAVVTLEVNGLEVSVQGRMKAQIIQQCAVSGEDVPVQLNEPLAFRFVPEREAAFKPDEEVELDSDELDEIHYDGDSFDLGEAVAQSLGLAIDPYVTGPNAEEFRKSAGLADEASVGPFTALAALMKK